MSATPAPAGDRSTARHSRSRLVAAARLALVALVLVLAGRVLVTQWDELRAQPLVVEPRWGWIALSALLVVATYALLVQLWRLLLVTWGQRVGAVAATRIWFVSSLGRYVPGRVWQIGAMAVLARRAGVSAGAATASAVANTLVNLLAGIVVALATGAALIDELAGTAAPVLGLRPRDWAVGVAAVGLAGLALLPWLLPRLVRTAERLTRRPLDVPPLPARVLWTITLGHAASWLLYGTAFQLLTAGVLGSATGATLAYVSVYTGSYIVGYLVLFMPGGLVAREAALVAALTSTGLTTLPAATVLAIASRLWLTVLEVLPGALFMAAGTTRRPPDSLPPLDAAP